MTSQSPSCLLTGASLVTGTPTAPVDQGSGGPSGRGRFDGPPSSWGAHNRPTSRRRPGGNPCGTCKDRLPQPHTTWPGMPPSQAPHRSPMRFVQQPLSLPARHPDQARHDPHLSQSSRLISDHSTAWHPFPHSGEGSQHLHRENSGHPPSQYESTSTEKSLRHTTSTLDRPLSTPSQCPPAGTRCDGIVRDTPNYPQRRPPEREAEARSGQGK